MKLLQIWNAREAWGRLAAMKKPPKLAYQLMKYGRKFAVEADTCEAHREKCVYEASGAEPGTVVNLEPGSAQFDAFIAKFEEFLTQESDLELAPVGMAELLDALEAEKGNALADNDLALLEPFFA